MAEGQWNRSRGGGSSESGSLTVCDARSGHFTLFAWNWPKFSATAPRRAQMQVKLSYPWNNSARTWRRNLLNLNFEKEVLPCVCAAALAVPLVGKCTFTSHDLQLTQCGHMCPHLLLGPCALCEFLLVDLHIFTGFSSQFNAPSWQVNSPPSEYWLTDWCASKNYKK
jgi:hypothetical protein